MNNVLILAGRIARNIELRKTQNGMNVCNITLAIPKNYKNTEGVYETDFITCVCYREIADRVAEWCKKGDMVGVRGRIQSVTYEKDDKKVYTTEIIAERVNFLSAVSKKEEETTKEVKSEEDDPFAQFGQTIENEMLPF